MKKVLIERIRIADSNNAVLTISGGGFRYCSKPCAECPWRRDALRGNFPAEAFRLSAHCSYDMAEHTFACHMSGKEKPAVCAGFLLVGAKHNRTIRMRMVSGDFDPRKVKRGRAKLYASYRQMAEANGVEKYDPVLNRSRD